MSRLSDRMKLFLLGGTKMAGTYDPSQALSSVEERMTIEEYQTATSFLKWIVKNDTTFGHGTIEAKYEQFLNETTKKDVVVAKTKSNKMSKDEARAAIYAMLSSTKLCLATRFTSRASPTVPGFSYFMYYTPSPDANYCYFIESRSEDGATDTKRFMTVEDAIDYWDNFIGF